MTAWSGQLRMAQLLNTLSVGMLNSDARVMLNDGSMTCMPRKNRAITSTIPAIISTLHLSRNVLPIARHAARSPMALRTLSAMRVPVLMGARVLLGSSRFLLSREHPTMPERWPPMGHSGRDLAVANELAEGAELAARCRPRMGFDLTVEIDDPLADGRDQRSAAAAAAGLGR